MRRTLLLCFFLLFLSLNTNAYNNEIQFRRIEMKDGLSNSRINCIFKDSRGFMWFGTTSGLNRYDGYKFKKFFLNNNDSISIPSNNITSLSEDKDGFLWMNTSLGYTIYDPLTETFNNNIKMWMRARGMSGNPDQVLIDKHKDMWLNIYGKGCYYYNPTSKKSIFFSQHKGTKTRIPLGCVITVSECRQGTIIVYNDGTFACLDGKKGKVLWVNRYIPENIGGEKQIYNVFVDSHNNYWVYTIGKTYLYVSKTKKWENNLNGIISKSGINKSIADIPIRDIKEDRDGRIWIATDHNGLLLLNYSAKTLSSFVNDKENTRSIQDNTLQSLYIDKDGTIWVGTYKNGVAYYSESIFKFNNIDLGDICTITVDNQGNYWCGTNDSGIAVYNPKTHSTKFFNKHNSSLGSDVVVSSCIAKDGSLWFGTYEGGLSHYQNGTFKTYRKSSQPGGLANDNVWSIIEDKNNNIWIGTLGSGLQCLDHKSGKFTTYNTANSKIGSDYISSLCFNHKGDIVIGHSYNFSIMNISNRKITSYKKTRSGQNFSEPAVQQIFVDSRNLIWGGTCSGANVYDMASDELYIIDNNDGLYGSMINSIIEDKNHTIWLSTDNGVSNIRINKVNGEWHFKVNSYNDMDGLQNHQLNQRAMFLKKDGELLIGGQDGLSVINPSNLKNNHIQAVALFSGLILFDHEVSVGETYNDRIILDKALNENKILELHYSENVFSIELASDNYGIPEKTRFVYKLEGFSDKWFTTPLNQHSVSFTNLAPGTYKLYVKVINSDGVESNKTSMLTIIIDPPFWRSIWAYMIYLIIIALIIYYFHNASLRRQKNKFNIEQIRREAEKDHEVDDMKMRFFTNVSHELRTPLSLVISPLTSMIKDENDEKKRKMLTMIHRNASQLLNLVNQLLDFRRNDMNGQKLNLLNGDIVSYIHNICNLFTALTDKKISLTFFSAIPSLNISFDEDKIGKIINNLLSNAFKFTPDGGRVDVALRVIGADNGTRDREMLEIKVSDTGIGINDADKGHIFERFYQANNSKGTPYGGSGVGLNLVKYFVDMHKGTVRVEDNPGGGSVFIIELPVRHDDNLSDITVPAVTDNDNPKPEDNADDDNRPKTVNNGKNYEVMIVDDSNDFLDFMSDILGKEYNISIAHNGKEALELIAYHKPDIILSDIMMPEMDGKELCRAIKKNPETERIPFVMLTARLAEEQKIEGLETGADDYITKPFNVDMLNLRIANLIKWNISAGHNGKIQPHIKEVQITSLDEKLVKSATEYVEKNLSNYDLSVEDMSGELNMSRVHLYKKLLSITGLTPSEFIRTIRLRHAEQLLRQSQLSVSEISYQVGFNNPRYFSKYFKEMYGVMPSVYKDEKGK